MQYDRVAITTDGAGAATVYSKPFAGLIAGIYLERDAVTPPDGTADFTITDHATGAAIVTATNLAASARFVPAELADDLAGADRAGVPALIPVHGAIKIVVAQGGASKLAYAHIYVRDC